MATMTAGLRSETFQATPEPKLAAKLTVTLWLAALALVAPGGIVFGQINTVSEYVSLLAGTTTGVALASLVYAAFHILSGHRRWVGYAGLIAALLVASALQTAADYAAHAILAAIFHDFERPSGDPVLRLWIVYFSLYLCNAALFWIAFTTREEKEQELRALEAENQGARAELTMLRLQLNPHFMCNALNAISSLILDRRFDAARGMTKNLSGFLRASLATNDEHEVRLHEEFDTVQAYLEVERVRFEEQLRVFLVCPPALANAVVPGFLLQPLLENAMKYAVAASTRPVSVTVSARWDAGDLVLVVEDDGPGLGAVRAEHSGGVGLSNIRSRLQIRFAAAASLSVERLDPGFRATIRLPYRTAPSAGSLDGLIDSPALEERKTNAFLRRQTSETPRVTTSLNQVAGLKVRFDISPAPRLAAKLTAILWFSVMSAVTTTLAIVNRSLAFGDYVSLVTGTATGFLLSGVVYAAFGIAAGRPRWLGYILLLAGVTAAAVLQTIADFGGQFLADQVFEDFTLPPFDPLTWLTVGIVYFTLYACNAILFWVSFSTRRVREQTLRAVQAETHAVRAKLSMLRLQLNPHFMSNSLNTILELLVEERYEEANTVTENLADFLRSALDAGDQGQVTLRTEFDTLEAYLEVSRVRFDNNLTVTLSCPSELEKALAPGFILQPIVENALKHSRGTVAPIRVTVEASRVGDDLVLAVTDNGPGLAATEGRWNRQGIGLENTRARLRILFGDRADVRLDSLEIGCGATIRLPYREVSAPGGLSELR